MDPLGIRDETCVGGADPFPERWQEKGTILQNCSHRHEDKEGRSSHRGGLFPGHKFLDKM